VAIVPAGAEMVPPGAEDVPPAFPVFPPSEPAVPPVDGPAELHPPAIPAAQNATANVSQRVEVRDSVGILFAINVFLDLSLEKPSVKAVARNRVTAQSRAIFASEPDVRLVPRRAGRQDEKHLLAQTAGGMEFHIRSGVSAYALAPSAKTKCESEKREQRKAGVARRLACADATGTAAACLCRVGRGCRAARDAGFGRAAYCDASTSSDRGRTGCAGAAGQYA
jgi:hypothetical protein